MAGPLPRLARIAIEWINLGNQSVGVAVKDWQDWQDLQKVDVSSNVEHLGMS